VKCLVTGATGFIGRHLCQQLLARGDSVTCLSLNGAKLPDGTPTLPVDLSGAMPGQELLHGLDVVFHLAGIAHQQAPVSAYLELNESATVQLARQCAAARVPRFVFLSSVKAMGAMATREERNELDCLEPGDAYGLSKWRAEEQLRTEFSADPMSIVILRPALVYGESAKGNLALLAKAVRAGLPRPPAGGARSMIAVADLVDLLCVLAAQSLPGVSTWIATDGEHYTTRRIYDQLRAAVGRRMGRAWLPQGAWRLACALLDLRRGRPADTTYEKLFGTELYSNRALLTSTSWRPQIQLEQLAPRIMAAAK